MNLEFEKLSKYNALEYAKINTKSWKESYINIIDNEFLNKINSEIEILKMKNNLINNLNDGSKRFLLKVNNEYVGLFRIRKTKYENYAEYGELGALYLLNIAKNKGLGKLMFNKAKEELKKMGYTKMILGCLINNPANDFYIKMGGKFIKQNPIIIGNQELKENLYQYNLD